MKVFLVIAAWGSGMGEMTRTGHRAPKHWRHAIIAVLYNQRTTEAASRRRMRKQYDSQTRQEALGLLCRCPAATVRQHNITLLVVRRRHPALDRADIDDGVDVDSDEEAVMMMRPRKRRRYVSARRPRSARWRSMQKRSASYGDAIRLAGVCVSRLSCCARTDRRVCAR